VSCFAFVLTRSSVLRTLIRTAGLRLIFLKRSFPLAEIPIT
jgi:hypothetical protein